MDRRIWGVPISDLRARAAQHHWIWKPLLLFVITRLGIALTAYLSGPLLVDSPSPPPYHLRPPNNLLLDVFGSRWDTGFYVSIAEEGYFYEGVALPSVAFFPLLPLMMRAMTPLTGDPLLAGLLISNLSMLLAAMLFYRLAVMQAEGSTAERAVWYLLIFPTAFFGTALYGESLFLLCSIGALYFARRGFWEVAGLFGVAATLTRLIGLIVAPMLLVEWLIQRRRTDPGKKHVLNLLAPALTPAGTIAYMVYLDRTFGDPFAFLRASAVWERIPRSPIATVAELLQTPGEGWGRALLAGRVHVDNLVDFGMVLLFLIFAVILLVQRRWPEGTFVLSGISISIGSGLLMSQRRYVWVLFPAYLLLADWGKRKWADRLITTLCLMGLALFTALFANGYWVA